MLGPVLKGELVTLLTPQERDLPLFCEWFGRLEVTRFLLTRFPPTLGQEREWLNRVAENQTHVVWAITVEGRTVGVSSIDSIRWIDRTAGTGTVIGDTADWGHGYGSEATRLRTRFAFEELNLDRLETFSLAHNAGMHRALEKVGYRRVGEFHHFRYAGGQWHDAVIFELLRTDWRADR